MKIEDLRHARADQKTPLVCLTAYTAPMAALLDDIADILLVGDSLAMVLYGHDTTRNIDLETMIAHGRAVARNCRSACVVLDMPYGSYEDSPDQALENASYAIKQSGCQAVKIEGGQEMASTAEKLVENNIPVIGHIGLLPQSATEGFHVQGRKDAGRTRIIEDAKALQDAGASAIVIECVIQDVANQITQELEIPTIGIGASSACDGQILVTEDMLGVTRGKTPRFVRKYADLGQVIRQAAEEYKKDVLSGDFPGDDEVYRK